ncbi:hypothetical protein [Pedobacter sp. JY14-1]|uniref:hypothetical protein n=1 Tax=Pedobacter sp. JY14-1 TaxID=3034151 RepID=UPI0023E1698C|nr:hypothetical protein [Pedobacter sp. JY14-1]
MTSQSKTYRLFPDPSGQHAAGPVMRPLASIVDRSWLLIEYLVQDMAYQDNDVLSPDVVDSLKARLSALMK